MLKCRLSIVFCLIVFQFFTSLFSGKLFRIMLFDFDVSGHKDSMASQFIDKSFPVLQQRDSITKRHTQSPTRYCLYLRR